MSAFPAAERLMDMAIKKILVPLDGSENAEKIGGWVAGLAAPLKAEVALTTVVDPDKIELPEAMAQPERTLSGERGPYDRPGYETAQRYFAGSGGVVGEISLPPGERPERAPAFGTQVLDRVMQQAGEYLAQESERLNASGVKCTYKALMGDPAEMIVQHAGEINAEMIAMATHRGSAVARGVLGSVTDRVLRSSHIPVMAVHPESVSAFSGPSGQPEVVVIPLDGSERSASAVGLALDIAKACRASVVFFKAIQYPYYGVTAVDAAYYQTDYGITFQRHEAEEYLAPFVERAEKAGLKAKALVVTGAPAARLLDEVKSMPRPLIVMSTRGASGIKRWVLGSVTDKVVRSSGLPVLVVPPKGE